MLARGELAGYNLAHFARADLIADSADPTRLSLPSGALILARQDSGTPVHRGEALRAGPALEQERFPSGCRSDTGSFD
jgi:hypothetical protein